VFAIQVDIFSFFLFLFTLLFRHQSNGRVYIHNSSFVKNELTIKSDCRNVYGGAIWIESASDVTISHSIFDNNELLVSRTEDTHLKGGAIGFEQNIGQVTVIESLFSNNRVYQHYSQDGTYRGGKIYPTLNPILPPFKAHFILEMQLR